MTACIAIVGMACCYPDARSAAELWENVLAQRQAFRRLPDERLRLADYFSADRSKPDCLYSGNAALIEGYEFDRLRYKVAGSTFRSADLTHWLALDIAAQTLADAGFTGAEGLPRETTGVFLGNTLTGEFSRANTLRLRWPYVRRVIEPFLVKEEWSTEHRDRALREIEVSFKQPFAPIDEESLAGGLSNTIAGRICNYFDLQGGGYTVDGACASSLLAITNACSALTVGDLDAALAGGVDLSLDPFELVGFAKAGALATDEMRIYDMKSNGFWPGEGCGFVLLMRYADALAKNLRVYAVIRGWGVSSDGNGGITRPDIDGQVLALRRAYKRAGFGIETVTYFEGHGTGTSVGDAVELQALTRARREANDQTPPAAIGSIKANIGHPKAAAGSAGLIKAVLALNAGIIPATTGCQEPHPELRGISPALRALKTAEVWPKNQVPRAGVSSMGFGGINAHVVVEGKASQSRPRMGFRERSLISSSQDSELFLFSSDSAMDLQRQVARLAGFAARLSIAELSDLAAQLEKTLVNQKYRAAVVAGRPAEFADRLIKLNAVITAEKAEIDMERHVFFGAATTEPLIGFLFPGQGSPSHLNGGALCRRFDLVQELYVRAQLDADKDEIATATAQPAIVTASIAGLQVMDRLGVTASLAVGHSLGELTALHWAGAIDEESVLRLAKTRGKAMTGSGKSSGSMASIGAGVKEVLDLLNGTGVSVAALNSRNRTVVSGPTRALNELLSRARKRHLSASKLRVSHAFHSALVADAATTLAPYLEREEFRALQRPVVSTVTGKRLLPNTNLPDLLLRQITSPVLFMEAVMRADSEGVDLWLEVGPGAVLSGIMGEITETPVVSLDAGGDSLRGLLCAIGAAFVLGHPVNHQALFAGRFTRAFDLDWQPKFFVNPCELAPVGETAGQRAPLTDQIIEEEVEADVELSGVAQNVDPSVLDLVTRLVAEHAELPMSAVSADSRFLSDLHLNSISVGQLVSEVAHRLRLPRPISPTDFADATLREVVAAFDEQLDVSQAAPSREDSTPEGIDSWVRPFLVELVERHLAPRVPSEKSGAWRVLAPPEHPFAEALRCKFAGCGAGRGIVLCLPPLPDETIVGQLLEAAKLVLAEREGTTFVLVQHRQGASAFARTLHLEAPWVTACIVNVPQSHEHAAEWVLAEALAADGYVEATYDDQGRRYESVVRPMRIFDQAGELPLTTRDVLLVTGGGKGITAECALSLAKESGCRLAILGRSLPEVDDGLSENLNRMAGMGVEVKYISADVTDQAQVRESVQEFEKKLGKITGILHGAGRNVPQLLSNLDEEMFRRSLAVKVQGARNLLAAVDPGNLRLLITFGSIIARTGLPGEADYGLANEWLTQLTEEWQRAHPSCRCLALEWSVWSGKGMGDRLGGADRFMQQGITPIPPDQGVAVLTNLVRQSLPSVSVVVMGRFRDLPTFKVERPELPFLRFLEQTKVYYPHIELIVDAELSTTTDPYLNDHIFQGGRLLPAVIGLEAIAQAAMALAESTKLPMLESIGFHQPVIVPEARPLKIRLAALMREPGVVEVALRSEETAFQINHFQATCRFTESKPVAAPAEQTLSSPVSLDPERDLYGGILFQTGRFRRLSNYRLLQAKACVAEIMPDGTSEWFSRYLPGKLVLGDPGARDAALHAIQACIPHATLLPVGLERLWLGAIDSPHPLFVHANECSREGDLFTYNLSVLGADGSVHERWEGLRLRSVGGQSFQGPWVESLLSPYIERRVQELIPGALVSVALFRSADTDHRARSNRAIQIAIGEEVEILHRPDGKPEVRGERTVSAAHSGNLTLAVASLGSLSCDIEQVLERAGSAWLDLLGEQHHALARLIARKLNEDESVTATRVWVGTECLRKIGAMIDAPLRFASSSTDGWMTLMAGRLSITTYVAQMRERNEKLALAVAVKRV